MLAPELTAVGEMVWRDRGGNSAKLTVRFPFSIGRDTAFSSLTAIANAAQAISDAAIERITLRYNYHEDGPIAPGILSDVGYYLCLYYSNDVDTEPVFVPSPRTSILETSGSFAGIRLDMANPEVVSLTDALTSALGGILAPDGLPWNRWLGGGGRTL